MDTISRSIDKIKNLRVMKVRGISSPHKYILLLTIANLFDSNPKRANEFPYTEELESAFIGNWLKFFPETDPKEVFLEYPYYHLETDRIWTFALKYGAEQLFQFYKESKSPHYRFTAKRIKETIEYASLSDDFLTCMRSQESRQQIVVVLRNIIQQISNARVQSNVNLTEMAKISENNLSAELINSPFVAYLNSLHSITPTNENALAGSQSTKQYFCYLHVPMKVADYIYSKLTEGDGRHVILTGHAGDGKSTIGLELYKKFKHLPHEKPLKNPMKEQEIVRAEGGYDILLVKDMSELPSHKRQRILNEAIGASNARFFIISNTGTLLETFQDYFKGRGPRNSPIENEILKAIDSRSPKPLESFPFLVINLAQVDNIETAIKILDRMVAPELWECCNGSECEARCPIYANVKLMQNNLPIVRERMLLAYRRMVEYGERLTLRQISAHLAYMITSGLTCEQIAKFTIKPSPLHLARYLFFNRFFGDDGVSLDHSARQLKAIRSISNQEFGLHPCSSLERGLWIHSEVNPLSLGVAAICSCFEELRSIGARIAAEGDIPSESARRQIRRMLYFLEPFGDDHKSVYIKTFLNSPMILDFVRWQRANGELSLKEQSILKARVMHVIQEHFSGVRLPELISSEPEVFITLNRHSKDIRQSAQIVLSKYHTDDFNVDLEPDPTPIGDDRCILVLKEKHSGVKLLMDLPFLDYVMMRRQGEVGQILQDSYADRLERFKSQLLNAGQDESHGNIMLVRLRTNRTFRKQTFAIRDNKLEVLND